MVYQSRKKYKSKRERLKNSLQRWKLIFIFGMIALAGYLFFNRVYFYDYIRIYFS